MTPALWAGGVAGCTDPSCPHYVGTPSYVGPHHLEVARAIAAWAAMWKGE